MQVTRLERASAGDAADVLYDAFSDYPMLLYFLKDSGKAIGERLHALITYFVMARFYRDEPVLAIREGGNVQGVALVTLPGEQEAPAEMVAHRERLWASIGEKARARYEDLGRLKKDPIVDDPHHHLNLIGVRRTHQGRGIARRLLEAVHRLSHDDPESVGVTLTTEVEGNVGLYEHFGYRIVQHVQITDDLQSWGFFRPDDTVRL